MQFRPWPHVSTPVLERVFKVEFREAACGSIAALDETSDMPPITVTLGASNESDNNVTRSSLRSPVVNHTSNDITPHQIVPMPPLPSDPQPQPPSPAVE